MTLKKQEIPGVFFHGLGEEPEVLESILVTHDPISTLLIIQQDNQRLVLCATQKAELLKILQSLP